MTVNHSTYPISVTGQGGGETAALIFGAGTSSSPATTATADKNFVGLWTQNTATSGDNRGIYNRFYLAGAGGGGESLRSFTTISDVTAGTAHGAHVSLSFASTGKVSGLGVAMRATLHIANQATQSGTMSAMMAEIYSDGATSDPAGSVLSFFRVVNGGNATGAADVDTDAYLLHFDGLTAGAGKTIGALGNEPTWTSKTRLIKCKIEGVGDTYIVAIDL